MKTESRAGGSNPVWSDNVDLENLTSDSCLPVIGSCHVSSIFSHLGVTEQEKTIQNLTTPQNIELIVLDEETNNEQETKTENFTILKTTSVNETSVDLSKNGNVQKYKKIRCKSSLPLLKCNICPFVCLEESKIDEHLNKAHKNESNLILERLECPACINVFHHKISLRAHLSFDHQISNSDLMQVMQSFKNDFLKQTNNIKDIESNNESSTQCKDEFALKYMMNTEKILDTDSNIEEMNIIQSLNISENLEDESNLQVMKNIEHLGEPENSIVTLPIVDLTQNNAERKFTDMIKRTEKENKIYDIKTLLKCAFCKTRLSNRENMNYHVSCHFDTKYKCPECGEIFAVWKPLTGHLWRLHKIDMELFGCDKCEYKTPSLAKLNNIHKLIHSDFKGYSCDQCSKAFKNIKQLRNHKILHKDKSRDLSLYCDVCKRPYFDKRQLRLHMDSVHKKLKPYLCNFCGYKGTTKHSLKMHTRQHTGEKPFSCNECNYTTSDHNSLRRHKLRHSGQKPYKCVHCDYACIQSSTYKLHLKTKHPGLENELLYSCNQCQFKTINRNIYSCHMSTVH